MSSTSPIPITHTQLPSAAGLVFLSHSSIDKPFVEQLLRLRPRSHLFYDIQTIEPGTSSLTAIKAGLERADVFVIFLSAASLSSPWVGYETTLAELQSIRRPDTFQVLVVPITSDVSWGNAPDWMHQYQCAPHNYTVSDISRAIDRLYRRALTASGRLIPHLFIGREASHHEAAITINSRQAQTGTAVNFLIFSGFQSIGRSTLAKTIVNDVYPGLNSDGPVFSLPPLADGVDLYLALRRDIDGPLPSLESMSTQQKAFFALPPASQADTLVAALQHYADINEVVYIRSSFGLRDRRPVMKDWVHHLFVSLQMRPNIKIVWLSERQLQPRVLHAYPNVMQFAVSELAPASVEYLFSKLLDLRNVPVEQVGGLVQLTNGHPGPVYQIAGLLGRQGRSPQSLLSLPEDIDRYQEGIVSHTRGRSF